MKHKKSLSLMNQQQQEKIYVWISLSRAGCLVELFRVTNNWNKWFFRLICLYYRIISDLPNQRHARDSRSEVHLVDPRTLLSRFFLLWADDLFKRRKTIIIKIFMLLFILDSVFSFVFRLNRRLCSYCFVPIFVTFFIKTLGRQYRWCQIIIILQLGIYH